MTCCEVEATPPPNIDITVWNAVAEELRDIRANIAEQEIYNNVGNEMKTCRNESERTTVLDMIHNDQECIAFIGIRLVLLESICEAITEHDKDKNFSCCSVKRRVAMALCKLRLNLSFICVSVLFHLPYHTCIRYFYGTLVSLYTVLRSGVHWSSKEEVLNSLPKCFQPFCKTRIVLDCTEIRIDKPECLNCRLGLYSHYKGCETVKFLLGVSPSGLITFLSEPFGGRASDKAIFNHSDILERLLPGNDAIMVDKGFLIENECASYSIDLIRPPHLGKRKQLTAQEAIKTKKIASARVHVERAIQRLKLFRFLKGPIPWRTAGYLNMIINIIAAIVNLSPPILSEERF